MNKTSFRESSKELPAEPGKYEARAIFGKYPVYFDGAKWFSIMGDPILVNEWR